MPKNARRSEGNLELIESRACCREIVHRPTGRIDRASTEWRRVGYVAAVRVGENLHPLCVFLRLGDRSVGDGSDASRIDKETLGRDNVA
jgi:hypothetical protein